MRGFKNIAAFIIIVAIIGGLGWLIFAALPGREQAPAPDGTENSVRRLVANFGEQLKQVSLLAPDASTQIKKHYAPYVADTLLGIWMKSPKSAPGRLTSSPWPERIEITRIELISPRKFKVNGHIVLMTSLGKMDKLDDHINMHPIELTVEQKDTVWQISSLQNLNQQR